MSDASSPRLSLRTNRREAFARAVAEGHTPRDAWIAAGFKSHHNAPVRSAALRDVVKVRIAELRRARVDVARDLVTTIDGLTRLVEDALREGSVPALNVARFALAEIGDLKVKLGVAVLAGQAPGLADATFGSGMQPPHMTEAEWIEAFVPKPNIGP